MQGLFREIAGIAIIRKTGVDLSESSNARDPEIKGIRSRTTIRRDFLTKAPPPKPLRIYAVPRIALLYVGIA